LSQLPDYDWFKQTRLLMIEYASVRFFRFSGDHPGAATGKVRSFNQKISRFIQAYHLDAKFRHEAWQIFRTEPESRF